MIRYFLYTTILLGLTQAKAIDTTSDDLIRVKVKSVLLTDQKAAAPKQVFDPLPPPPGLPQDNPQFPTKPLPTNPGPGPITFPSYGWNNPISDLLNTGRQIWNIIVENNPTYDYKEMMANALPHDVRGPIDLASWKLPQTIAGQITYKNSLGSEAINMKYKVIYTPGGRYHGKGQYLANVSIHPIETRVGWGLRLDSNVQIVDAVNVGTDEDPIAGLQILINWTIRPSVGRMIQGRSIYFVQGDGKWSVVE